MKTTEDVNWRNKRPTNL